MAYIIATFPAAAAVKALKPDSHRDIVRFNPTKPPFPIGKASNSTILQQSA
jgi:hypothetical protein